MSEIIKGNPEILNGMDKLCTAENAIRHTSDSFGNSYFWYELDRPEKLLAAAKILHAQHARLAQIAAYGEKDSRYHNCCYEFVEAGVVYNVTAHMDEQNPSVPSITPFFANADWHEREMMELFGIKVTAQPNPNRLFLDEKLDSGVLDEIVPLSILMNGANSTDLWERILADKESR